MVIGAKPLPQQLKVMYLKKMHICSSLNPKYLIWITQNHIQRPQAVIICCQK